MLPLRIAFRTLLKTPFITLVAVVSLAFGIGANSAIFSIFNQMLLKSIPAANPERLVNLSAPGPKPGSQSCNQAGDCDAVFSYPMFRDLEAQQSVLTGIAAHRVFDANLSYQGETAHADGVLVSGGYFAVLELTPVIGRLINSSDEATIGQSPVVVLSHSYWTTRFGASAKVLNETLIVNGQPLTIVGVAPRGFNGTTLGSRPQIFVPITLRGLMSPGFKGFDNRRTYWAYLFGRLKPGVSIEQARSGLNVPYHAIINEVEAPLQKSMSPQTLGRFKSRVVTLDAGARGQSSLNKEARTPLYILMAVTGIVLLIACANIANLLLVRASGRATEMAVRLSIGASRAQLIRHLLIESVLLAAMGGVAGLLVARLTLDAMRALLPAEITNVIEFAMDPAVFVAAAMLSLTTGVLFGLFPALHSTRPDLASTLKGTSGQPGGSGAARRFRQVLATTQIMLAMALLASAALFTKSLVNVTRVELGVKVDHLLTFGISPELNAYTPERARVLFERAEQTLAAIPGVTGVTVSVVAILAGNNWGNDVSVQGFTGGPDVDQNARFNEVGPGYFATVGVPLLAGREFTRADRVGTAKVAMVNEAFAKKFNMGHDVVGKLMSQSSGNPKLDIEIIGLVHDAKYSQVKQAIPPLFFRPYLQDEHLGSANIYVRTSGDPVNVLPSLTAAMKTLDPALPLEQMKTVPQQVRENVFLDRFITTMSAAFAGLATVLAGIGLYGVLAYTVAQRTREFGLRMALGADPSRVRMMVLRQVGWMTLIGGTIGLIAAFALGRMAESILFQMQSYDPVAFIGAAILLAIVALGAGFVPALRASRIDPMTALRYE
jgi:predicted permease